MTAVHNTVRLVDTQSCISAQDRPHVSVQTRPEACKHASVHQEVGQHHRASAPAALPDQPEELLRHCQNQKAEGWHNTTCCAIYHMPRHTPHTTKWQYSCGVCISSHGPCTAEHIGETALDASNSVISAARVQRPSHCRRPTTTATLRGAQECPEKGEGRKQQARQCVKKSGRGPLLTRKSNTSSVGHAHLV